MPSLPAAIATPLIAAFIMVLWDLNLDPGAATLGKWWIWQQGGGFFGVPLSNYLGWFFTVYVFMQLFALYLRARGPVPEVAQPKSYFAQAIIMYAVIAFLFSIEYAVKGSGEVVTDATGAAWRSGDIRETAAITSLLDHGVRGGAGRDHDRACSGTRACASAATRQLAAQARAPPPILAIPGRRSSSAKKRAMCASW